MLELIGLVACALVWWWAGRRSVFYLLPVYLLTVAIDMPWVPDVVMYPDLGLGTLVKPAVKVGDVLLLATFLVSPGARQALRTPAPLALAAVSAVGVIAGLMLDRLPTGTVWYLGVGPLRLGLLMAVFLSAGRVDHHFIRATVLAIGAFLAPVAMLVGASVVPRVGELAESVGMTTTDGRIAFPALGNNKIGVCLVLLCAVLLIAVGRKRWGSVVPTAVLVATLVCGFGSLRFSTTALFVLFCLVALRSSAVSVIVACVMGAAGAFYVAVGGSLGARSLSVLSGDFSLAEDSTLETRIQLWGSALDVWRADPLLGRVGGWEWGRPLPRPIFALPIETHNEFLWWLASFGIVGVVALTAVLLPAVLSGMRQGFIPAAATVAVLLALMLNAATTFPGAAACLALFLSLPKLLDGGAGGVLPDRAVRPDRLAEGGVVGHRASADRHR